MPSARKFWAFSFVAFVILASSTGAANGEPSLHFSSNISVRTDTNPDVELRLPPGYFFDEDAYKLLDTEVRRLQDSEMRLGAENKSLRNTAEGWQPGWKILASAVVLGLVGGWYIHSTL